MLLRIEDVDVTWERAAPPEREFVAGNATFTTTLRTEPGAFAAVHAWARREEARTRLADAQKRQRLLKTWKRGLQEVAKRRSVRRGGRRVARVQPTRSMMRVFDAGLAAGKELRRMQKWTVVVGDEVWTECRVEMGDGDE